MTFINSPRLLFTDIVRFEAWVNTNKFSYVLLIVNFGGIIMVLLLNLDLLLILSSIVFVFNPDCLSLVILNLIVFQIRPLKIESSLGF